MAKLPVPQERVVFSGANFSQRRTGRGGGGLPLANALQQFAANKREELNQEAAERVQAAGVRAQREAGVDELVETPEGTTGVFEDAFQSGAEAVFQSQFNLTITEKLRELRQKHANDPEQFASEFNAVMTGTLEPLEESDPLRAEEVRAEMDAVGLETMFEIQDNVAARARAAATSEALANFADFEVEALADLNETGSEERLGEYLERGERMLTSLRNAGDLSDDQFISRRQDFRDSAAEEQAFGSFRRAVRDGDIGGAEAIIERTRRGILFDDNDSGRATAKELRTRLERMKKDAEKANGDRFRSSVRTIQNFQDLAQQGGRVSPDDPKLVEAFNQAVVSANTDAEVDQLNRLRQDLAISSALAPALNGGTPSQLLQIRQLVEESPDQLPVGRITDVTEQIDQRLRDIQAADLSGDITGLANLRPNDPPAKRLQARENLSDQFNVPINMVPVYGRDEVEVLNNEFNNRLGNDSTAALGIVDQFFSNVDPDLNSRIGLAQQYGKSDFSAIATIAALTGDPSKPIAQNDNARQLFELARQGRGLDPNEVSKTNPPTSTISEMAEAASLGQPDIRNQIETLLTNAWAAEATTRDEQGSGLIFNTTLRDEFDRLTAGMDQVTELSNGARVPEAMFDPQTRKRLDEALSNPDRFGVVPGDANTMDLIRPRPLPGGGAVWFSTRDPNALIEDPKTGDVLMTDIERPPAPTPEEDAGLLEGVARAAVRGLNASSRLISFGGFSSSTAPRAAEATGVPPNDLRALRMVFEDTPQEQRGDRNATTLFDAKTLESLDTGAYSAAWNKFLNRKQGRRPETGGVDVEFGESPPNPMSSVEGAAVAAGVLIDKFRKKYDSEYQALAAYWIGEENMDAMGDQWRDLLPEEADQFVARMGHHRRRLGAE